MVDLPIFYPLYVFPFIIFLIGSTLFAVFRATRNKELTKLVSIVLLLWAVIAIIVGLMGVLFIPNGPPLPLFFMLSSFILTPILFFSSSRFQALALSISVYLLIIPQAARILGSVFYFLAHDRLLPSYWATVVGTWDFLIGLFAPLVAFYVYKKLAHWRRIAMAYSVLGILDFIVAAVFAPLSIVYPNIFPTDITMEALSFFPIIMIPLFTVPTVFLLHFIVLIKLMRSQ